MCERESAGAKALSNSVDEMKVLLDQVKQQYSILLQMALLVENMYDSAKQTVAMMTELKAQQDELYGRFRVLARLARRAEDGIGGTDGDDSEENL